jgi:hypothetical protein
MSGGAEFCTICSRRERSEGGFARTDIGSIRASMTSASDEPADRNSYMLENGKYSAWFRTPNGDGRCWMVRSPVVTVSLSIPGRMNRTAIGSPLPSELDGFAMGHLLCSENATKSFGLRCILVSRLECCRSRSAPATADPLPVSSDFHGVLPLLVARSRRVSYIRFAHWSFVRGERAGTARARVIVCK